MHSDPDEVLLAERQWRRYERLRDYGHLDYVELAKKCDNFYLGDQWSEEDRNTLEEQGRPALTINLAMPLINTIIGEFMQTQPDVKLKALSTDGQDAAPVLDKLIKVIFNETHYTHKEAAIVADGLIQDRGFFDVRLDPMAEEPTLRITVEDPLDILLDIDAKEYDPDTWQEVIKSKWVSLDTIETTYGEKAADKLQELADSARYYGSDSMEVYQNSFGDAYSDATAEVLEDTESHREIRRIRIIDRQFRVNKRVHFLFEPGTGTRTECPPDWTAERCKSVAQKTGAGYFTRVESRIKWRVTADRVVLFEGWSPYKHFTIVPYFPYFRRGRPLGLMRNLLSPQELVNKVHSQELHVVNTTANSGYMVPTNSLTNMTVEELEERGAETGLVIEYNAVNGLKPEKIEPNKVPTGLERVGMKAAGYVRDISGVQPAVDGSDDPETSGKASQIKARRALVQVQVPRAHLQLTREILVRNMLDIVQTYYTDERMFVLTVDPKTLQGGQPESEEIIINKRNEIGQIKNDITKGKFKVVVGTQPSSETMNDAEYFEALALRSAGVAIPDDAMVMYSNLSEKGPLAERIRQATGQGQPSEEEMEAAEFVKNIKRKNLLLQLELLEAQVNTERSKADLNDATAFSKVKQLQQDMQKLIMELEADGAKTASQNEAKRDVAKTSGLASIAATKLSADASRATASARQSAQRANN